MTSLRTLLEIHERYRNSQALQDAFGDGYLYHHNLIIRNVRDAALKLGIKFTLEDFCDYQAFPLASLPEILKQNLIPYVNSYRPIAKLAGTRAGDLVAARVIPKGTASNHVLHESCHCIANRLLSTHSGQGTPNEQERVLQIMMSEAFANSCELMSQAYVSGKIHQELYELNSYLPYKIKNAQLLHEAFDVLDFRPAFKFVFLTFMFSNFLYKEIKPRGLQLVLSLAAPNRQLSKDQLSSLKKLGDIAFRLNYGFRTATAELYFRLLGFERSATDLLDFNFLSAIFKNAELVKQLDQFAEVAEHGAQTPVLDLSEKKPPATELKKAA
jgi:hypothetical protein